MLRRLDRRHGRLPVRARRGGQPRDRGPGLPARRHGHRARRATWAGSSTRPASSPTRSASRWPARSVRPGAGTRTLEQQSNVDVGLPRRIEKGESTQPLGGSSPYMYCGRCDDTRVRGGNPIRRLHRGRVERLGGTPYQCHGTACVTNDVPRAARRCRTGGTRPRMGQATSLRLEPRISFHMAAGHHRRSRPKVVAETTHDPGTTANRSSPFGGVAHGSGVGSTAAVAATTPRRRLPLLRRAVRR